MNMDDKTDEREETIFRTDVPLYVDVVCYGCKRRVALSNTNVFDGRYYCNRCMPLDEDDVFIARDEK